MHKYIFKNVDKKTWLNELPKNYEKLQNTNENFYRVLAKENYKLLQDIAKGIAVLS